jgi:hypothetical protein
MPRKYPQKWKTEVITRSNISIGGKGGLGGTSGVSRGSGIKAARAVLDNRTNGTFYFVFFEMDLGPVLLLLFQTLFLYEISITRNRASL